MHESQVATGTALLERPGAAPEALPTLPLVELATAVGRTGIRGVVRYRIEPPNAWGDPQYTEVACGEKSRVVRESNRLQDRVDGLAYAHTIFPDNPAIELLSEEGATSVVYADRDFAYKVFKNPHGGKEDPVLYSSIVDEVGGLQYLANAGFSPRPIVLVDASPEYRHEIAGYNCMPKNDFDAVSIPRVELDPNIIKHEVDRPVLVMEKEDLGPLDILDEATLKREVARLLEFCASEGLWMPDISLGADRKTNRLRVIDAGTLLFIGEETPHGRVLTPEDRADVVWPIAHKASGGNLSPPRAGKKGEFDPVAYRLDELIKQGVGDYIEIADIIVRASYKKQETSLAA